MFALLSVVALAASPKCTVTGPKVVCSGDGVLTQKIVHGSGAYSTWTSAVVEEGITELTDSCFGGCWKITSISLPNSLQKIGPYCFQSVSCTTFFIPKGVTWMSTTLFNSCTKMKWIDVATENEVYCSYEGSIYAKNMTQLFSVAIALTSINIPESVIEMGDSCMRHSRCQSVVIPNKVTLISPYAFAGSKLKTITIGASVSVIKNAVFDNCLDLTSIIVHSENTNFTNAGGIFQSSTEILFIEPHVVSLHLAAGINKIGDGVLTMADQLIEVTVDENNTVFSVTPDKALIIYQETTAYAAMNTIKSVIISDPIKEISNKCFANCQNLETAIINSATIKLGNDLFRGCTGLKQVTIESEVSTITDLCFSGANLCNGITMPESVHTICGSAFYNTNVKLLNLPGVVTVMASGCSSCKELTDVIFAKVETIEHGAFDQCVKLQRINFGNSLATLESTSFSRCTQITSVTLPKTITNLKAYAFSESTKLVNIFIEDGGVYESIDGVPYLKVVNGSSRTFIACPNGRTSITVVDGTRVIGDQSFYGCSLLHSITLPDEIESIEASAFYMCSSLVIIRIPGQIQFIGKDAFGSCDKLLKVLYCNNTCTVRSEGDPFPTNPEICVFSDYDTTDFCGHGVSAILDHQCNLPTGSFTMYVYNQRLHAMTKLYKLAGLMQVALLFNKL